jgi:lysophospholipase L1-like esterase
MISSSNRLQQGGFIIEQSTYCHEKRFLLYLSHMETNICVFGDSITWGAWDPKRGGWVARLRNYLETKRDNEIALYNQGVSGDNTNDLLIRFPIEAGAREPKIIIFAIGINDSKYITTPDNSRVPVEKFAQNINLLIEQSRKFTNRIVLVGLSKVDESKTAPWEGPEYYDNKYIQLYNWTLKQIGEKHKLIFINVFDLLSNSDLDDGLHPNAKGHKKIFEKVKQTLLDNKLI